MGMFDYVRYEHKCECGEIVTEFQSEDGPCLLKTLTPHQVKVFYTSCDNCGRWIQLYTKDLPPIPIEQKHKGIYFDDFMEWLRESGYDDLSGVSGFQYDAYVAGREHEANKRKIDFE